MARVPAPSALSAPAHGDAEAVNFKLVILILFLGGESRSSRDMWSCCTLEVLLDVCYFSEGNRENIDTGAPVNAEAVICGIDGRLCPGAERAQKQFKPVTLILLNFLGEASASSRDMGLSVPFRLLFLPRPGGYRENIGCAAKVEVVQTCDIDFVECTWARAGFIKRYVTRVFLER
jgi:hypothetical protein